MKPILLIILIVLLSLLITSCAERTLSLATIDVPDGMQITDAQCTRLNTYVRLCEVTLRDGTLCMVAHTGSVNGGVSIDCNWE